MQLEEFTGRLAFYHNVARPYVCKVYKVSKPEKITFSTYEGEPIYLDEITDPVIKSVLESNCKILTTLGNII